MPNYYDELEIEDFAWDPVAKLFHYPCPCGDRFEITKGQLRDGEEIAICPSCSLIVRVIYDYLDWEDYVTSDEEDGEEDGEEDVETPPTDEAEADPAQEQANEEASEELSGAVKKLDLGSSNGGEKGDERDGDAKKDDDTGAATKGQDPNTATSQAGSDVAKDK